jgi:hypothetical protein
MIVSLQAFDVCCETPGCRSTYGVPSRDERRARELEEVATHFDGWERDGEQLVCPSCARKRWHAKHSLVAAGCSAPR